MGSGEYCVLVSKVYPDCGSPVNTIIS